MRSDEFKEKYKGIRIARVGDIIIEFVYGVGIADFAVNICRTGTNECTKMNRIEWETLCAYAPFMRSYASEISGNNRQWLPTSRDNNAES